MSVAGFLTTVKRGGTSTALVDEPMTNTTGNTYQITDAARRILDRDVVPTFEDNGSPIPDSDIVSIDYMFGIVVFASAKTEPVTVATGNFIPTLDIVGANSHSLTMSRVLLDDTSYDRAAANGGSRTYITGLADIQAVINRWEELDRTYFNALNNRTPVLIEVRPGGSGDFFRAWMLCETELHSGDVADQEQQELTFQLDSRDPAAFGFGT